MTNSWTDVVKRHLGWVAVLLLVAAAVKEARGEQSADANQVVRAAVQSELRAARGDDSVWKYRDEDDSPGSAKTYRAIETPQGELRRLVAVNGHPLAGSAEQKELQRIRSFVDSPGAQAKARKDGEHDGEQATAFLKMLPDAFVWTVVSDTPQVTTLKFVPNPQFNPPTLESRVLAVMAGEMEVTKEGDRIESLRGRLTRDVKFGFGLLGKMNAGGTFNVRRREVGGGHWEITETHVHIEGRALLFKDISQNSDEVKTEWQPSEDRTLAEAAKELGVGGV